MTFHVVKLHRQPQLRRDKAARRSRDVELTKCRIVLGGDQLRLRREQLLSDCVPFHGMPDCPQISLSFKLSQCYAPGRNDHAFISRSLLAPR